MASMRNILAGLLIAAVGFGYSAHNFREASKFYRSRPSVQEYFERGEKVRYIRKEADDLSVRKYLEDHLSQDEKGNLTLVYNAEKTRQELGAEENALGDSLRDPSVKRYFLVQSCGFFGFAAGSFGLLTLIRGIRK